VLVYALENSPEFGERARRIFERVDAGELRGYTSELTLAEVLVKPLSAGADAIRQQYEQLLASPGPLTVLPVSRLILLEAARLRAGFPSLKLPDAIHAATAMLHQCNTFLTNDRRFESVGNLPVFLVSNLGA
jgi:predicted nucleic acid-binding protein